MHRSDSWQVTELSSSPLLLRSGESDPAGENAVGLSAEDPLWLCGCVWGVGWERMGVGCIWVPKALESISREEVRGQQYSLSSSTPGDGLGGLVSIFPYL